MPFKIIPEKNIRLKNCFRYLQSKMVVINAMKTCLEKNKILFSLIQNSWICFVSFNGIKQSSPYFNLPSREFLYQYYFTSF